jgi:hypothetical protein
MSVKKKNKSKKTHKKSKNKTKSRKIIRRKLIGGVDPIDKEDILYQDDLVCILRPEVKKGILLFTHFTQPKDVAVSLCKTGLKTGKKMNEEKINFGRAIYHPYIFFRAPYYSNDIDYTSVETEIKSLYGKLPDDSIAFIRVDPDKTYVFSSEIRVEYSPPYHTKDKQHDLAMLKEVNKSKKTLTRYLSIIKDNEKMKEKQNEQSLYHLYSSKKKFVVPKMTTIQQYDDITGNMIEDDDYKVSFDYPYNDKDISRESEILVSIPHVTPDYFVSCNN